MNTDFTEKARKYVAACRAAADKTDYFISRGFTPEIVHRFGLGYDEENAVIVIPYDRAGSYYSTRSVTGKDFRKPSSSESSRSLSFSFRKRRIAFDDAHISE